jgi:hypothetical protein
VRDFGRGIHADFPPGLLDHIVQDKVFTGQLTDEANKNREFDIIEVEGDASGGISSGFSSQGERKQKSTERCQQTNERGFSDPPPLSEIEKIHDFQAVYVGRPIIPRTWSSMTMGMKNGTIRLVIDTTNSHVCYLRVATATTDQRQISSIRRPGVLLG